jgi:phosphatidylserine/phosphatidylglycerophosphate/cardiolipin synthase-like enzyme
MTRIARPIAAPITPLTTANPIVGGPAVAQAVVDIAAAANSRIAYNAFRVTNNDVQSAITGAADRGVTVGGLIDADVVDKETRQSLASAGDVIRYAPSPGKQHSKAIVADARRGLVATDLADIEGLNRVEYGVEVRGDAARALDELVRLTHDAPASHASQAIRAAANHGIVMNEPAHGHTGLTGAVGDAVSGASSKLTVLTKELSSEDMATQIADAARRGVTVLVATESIPKTLRSELVDAGVTVRKVKAGKSEGRGMHGTLIASDDQTLVGSIYLKDSVLVPGRDRRSRELGVLLAGEPAAQIRSQALSALGI